MEFLLLDYRKKSLEKINVDIKKGNEYIFSELLNSKNIPSMIQLDLFIDNIKSFDDECNKYFSFLIDMWKSEMNKNKSIVDSKIKEVISPISHFVKVFYNKFQAYNDKHKSVMKQFPQFLQLFFKVLKQRFNLLVVGNKEDILNKIESYFMLIITFINYYPTLMRSFQKDIEEIISKIITLYFLYNKVTKSTIKLFIITYSMLFRLSPSMDVKFAFNFNLIITNIKHAIDIFKPRTLNESEMQSKELLFLKEPQNYNLTQGIKVIELYFYIMQYLFMLIPKTVYVNVDYASLFNIYRYIIEQYNNNFNRKNKGIEVSGLSRENYSIFLKTTMNNILESLLFQFKYFNTFLSPYHSIISSILNLLLLNQTNFQHNFILNKAFLEVIDIFIIKNSMYYPRVIDEIIYKFIYSTFPSLYLEYLEQNDKTVIKINNSYFKLCNHKTSLIQINKSISLEKILTYYSIKENSYILLLYLKILNSYVLSEHYSMNNKSNEILSGLINLIIIPSYSKFIFNIKEEIKRQIIILLDNCYRRNRCIFNRGKLYSFLKGFYSKDDLLQSYCDNLIKELNLTYNDIDKYNSIEITNQIISQNVKLSENIKESIAKHQEEIKDNIFLNKKRKHIIESKREVIQEQNEISINKFPNKNNQEKTDNNKNPKLNDTQSNVSQEFKITKEKIPFQLKENEEEEIEIPDIN